MDTAHGLADPALSGLSTRIREYSLYQAVLLVMDRLRDGNPDISDDALYERLEFVANPSLGFPGCDVEHVTFFTEHGQLRARLCFNLMGLVGSSSAALALPAELSSAAAWRTDALSPALANLLYLPRIGTSWP